MVHSFRLHPVFAFTFFLLVVLITHVFDLIELQEKWFHSSFRIFFFLEGSVNTDGRMPCKIGLVEFLRADLGCCTLVRGVLHPGDA